MFCPQCGAQAPDSATFCPQCGNNLTPAVSPQPATVAQPPPAGAQQRPRIEDLASLGQRFGSWLIDFVVGFSGLIPFVGFFIATGFTVGNWIGYRRGMTLGLKLVGARIMRENGDVSGFFHTAVRGMAAGVSILPLGLGYWWALWDPYRQTWHDKIMHTYVWKNTPELATRRGTSSGMAIFWFLVIATFLALLVIFVLIYFFVFLGVPDPFSPEELTSPRAGNSTAYKSGVGTQYPITADSSHVPEGQTVSYSTTPPTSGKHWARWANCGFYPEGLPDELIVHNLEHSNIVVSYNLAPSEVGALRQAVDNGSLSRAWGVTRYHDRLEPGTVALAAWGVLDTMKGVDRKRIERFYGAYAGRLGPEKDAEGLGIPCQMGWRAP